MEFCALLAASPGDNDSNDGTSDEEMDDLTSDLSSPSKAVSSFLDVTYWKQYVVIIVHY
jgi:hypothetical protein